MRRTRRSYAQREIAEIAYVPVDHQKIMFSRCQRGDYAKRLCRTAGGAGVAGNRGRAAGLVKGQLQPVACLAIGRSSRNDGIGSAGDKAQPLVVFHRKANPRCRRFDIAGRRAGVTVEIALDTGIGTKLCGLNWARAWSG